MSKKHTAIPVRPGLASPAYQKLAKALRPIFKRLLHDKAVIFTRPNATP